MKRRNLVALIAVLAIACIGLLGAAAVAAIDVPPATVVPAQREPANDALMPGHYPEAPALAPSTDALLLSTDFSDGLGAWQAVATVTDEAPSKWLIVNGKLVQNGNGSDMWTDDPAVLLRGDNAWSNYDLYSQIYPTAGSAVGVAWRASGGNYYRVSLYGKSSANTQPKAVLELVQGDNVTALASAPVSTWPGYTLSQWMTVRASTIGARQRVWVGSTLVFDKTDSTLSAGQVGVYGTSDGGSAFDNVRVTASAAN